MDTEFHNDRLKHKHYSKNNRNEFAMTSIFWLIIKRNPFITNNQKS